MRKRRAALGHAFTSGWACAALTVRSGHDTSERDPARHRPAVMQVPRLTQISHRDAHLEYDFNHEPTDDSQVQHPDWLFAQRADLNRPASPAGRLIVAAAALVLAACANPSAPLVAQTRSVSVSDAPAPASQQVLRRRIAMSPRTLDPTLATGQPATDVIQDLFEGLTTISAGGAMEPGVAASWTISPDGRTYIFHLRTDARWSNGKPVTAGDFVYAWRREVDPETAAEYAQSLSPIVNAQAIIDGKKPPDTLGVTAVDAHTLQVRLVQRTPYFLVMLYKGYFMPLYPPAVRRWGEAWTRPGHLISDGPFYLTAWVINGHLTLRKNPYYWDAAHVRLRKEIDYPIASSASALSRYLAGDLDYVGMPAFPSTDVDRIKRELGGQVRISPTYACAYLGMLVQQKPFDNRDLRLALTMTLNRRVLDDKLLHRLDLPAYSLFPPLPGYTQHLPAWAHWPMAKRITVARRLYHAAGYSKAHPLRVKLLYMNEGVQTTNFMEAVVTLWNQALGTQITLWPEQWKVMLQDLQYKNAKLYWSAWVGDYPAPYTFAQLFVKGFAMNYGSYYNPAYQKAVEAALTAPDKATRYALYGRAEDILNHDAPFIPLYFYMSRELVKPYVAGVKANNMTVHLARYIWIRKHTVTHR